MRIRPLLLAVAAAGTLAACGSATAAAPPSASANTVSIKGFAYGPATLHVNAGTTVTWTNNDPTAHTTTSDTSDAQSWDSGTSAPTRHTR